MDDMIISMLKAVVFAFRETINRTDPRNVRAANEMANEILMDGRYRSLSGEQRATLADASLVIRESLSKKETEKM